MAFLLRNISYSADGRQIVRTSRITDDLLKIGRDPDNDIVLNDLAVALHHATLEQISRPGSASGRSGLTLEIDGASPSSARSTVTIGGTVGIGPFRCASCPRRWDRRHRHRRRARRHTEAEDKFDTRRFALSSVMPGKRPIAWTLAIVVLACSWLADLGLLCAGARQGRICPGLSWRPRLAERQPVARPCRARQQLPGLPRRRLRCAQDPAPPATPTSTTMPTPPACRARPTSALEPGPARRRQDVRPRAAASTATPSMRACRR